jgi:hypothetical protein
MRRKRLRRKFKMKRMKRRRRYRRKRMQLLRRKEITDLQQEHQSQ